MPRRLGGRGRLDAARRPRHDGGDGDGRARLGGGGLGGGSSASSTSSGSVVPAAAAAAAAVSGVWNIGSVKTGGLEDGHGGARRDAARGGSARRSRLLGSSVAAARRLGPAAGRGRGLGVRLGGGDLGRPARRRRSTASAAATTASPGLLDGSPRPRLSAALSASTASAVAVAAASAASSAGSARGAGRQPRGGSRPRRGAAAARRPRRRRGLGGGPRVSAAARPRRGSAGSGSATGSPARSPYGWHGGALRGAGPPRPRRPRSSGLAVSAVSGAPAGAVALRVARRRARGAARPPRRPAAPRQARRRQPPRPRRPRRTGGRGRLAGRTAARTRRGGSSACGSRPRRRGDAAAVSPRLAVTSAVSSARRWRPAPRRTRRAGRGAAPAARRQRVAGGVVVFVRSSPAVPGSFGSSMRAVLPSRSRAPRLIPVRHGPRDVRGAAVRGAGAARELMSGSPVPYAMYARPGESLLVSARPDPGGSRVPGLRYNDCPYAAGPSGAVAAAVPAAVGGAAGTASRSGASGSVTVPDSSSKSPCASLVTAAGTGGARSATARRPDRTSSGRTAGVTCRTTSRSIAQGPSPGLSRARRQPPGGSGAWAWRKRLQVGHGGAGVEGPHAVLRLALDLDGLGGEERGDGRRASSTADAVEPQLPHGGGEPVGEAGGAGLDGVGDVEAGRQRLVERARAACRGRGASVRAISRYSASLPVPVGAALAYETLGCGVKPAEYAMGTSARRSARSKARWKSRWLVNRRRPRLV